LQSRRGSRSSQPADDDCHLNPRPCPHLEDIFCYTVSRLDVAVHRQTTARLEKRRKRGAPRRRKLGRHGNGAKRRRYIPTQRATTDRKRNRRNRRRGERFRKTPKPCTPKHTSTCTEHEHDTARKRRPRECHRWRSRLGRDDHLDGPEDDMDEETYPGRDGQVRYVKIRTQHGMTERPAARLYPL